MWKALTEALSVCRARGARRWNDTGGWAVVGGDMCTELKRKEESGQGVLERGYPSGPLGVSNPPPQQQRPSAYGHQVDTFS